MAFKSFLSAYRNFFYPKPTKPPFLHICQVGDPILRAQAKPVPPDDVTSPEIQEILSRMQLVMKKYDCVGLSAPQIGIPLRILILEFLPKRRKQSGEVVYAAREMSTLPLTVFINPKMQVVDYKKVEFPEACESLLGYSAVVPRYRAVTLSGLDQRGENINLEGKDSVGNRRWEMKFESHKLEKRETLTEDSDVTSNRISRGGNNA
ncbi:hypothetical protein Pmani_003117 [Petrolisthes manimaculis]|uniref:Peptide deformylase n=1 Tax=Petrolisthes manimaculis TaxID=1843537 RepID=A0AAE1QH81_9EUCA|nr:hypothetical protein Pmani_003117 [Petrolisthes manimaculis]